MKTFELPNESFYLDTKTKEYKIVFLSKEEYYHCNNCNEFEHTCIGCKEGCCFEFRFNIETKSLYHGLVDNIPNELLSKVVDCKPDRNRNSDNYFKYPNHGYCFGTPYQSIKSLCELEYCIIYKNE